MTQWLAAPVTFTQPVSQRVYYGAAVMNLAGTVYTEVAYTDDYSGNSETQPETYLNYAIDFFGQLSAPVSLTAINTSNHGSNPDVVPTELTYGFVPFHGPTSQTIYAAYWLSQDDTVQTEIYDTATSNTIAGPTMLFGAGRMPVVINSVRLATSGNNNLLAEVDNSVSDGATAGVYDIFNASGDVIVSNAIGFSFTDGLAHVSTVGGWNPNYYAQFVEVWNDTSGSEVADVQLSVINSATGAVTTGWTAQTSMESITRIGYDELTGPGAGLILLTDGTDSTGQRGFVQSLVNDSTYANNGVGGTMSAQSATHYSGAVIKDARITGSGLGNNEFVLYWVDANGLTIELEDASFDVLETYNIPQANSNATIVTEGDGRLLVTYNIRSTDSNGHVSAVDDYTILDTRTAPIDGPGTAVNNMIAGTIYNDTITHTAGAMTIDGGGGEDTYEVSAFSSSQLTSLTRNSDGTVSLALPDGSDTLIGIDWVQFSASRVWIGKAQNDFNGDGKSDIVWSNTNGDTTAWYSNGSDSFSATDLGSVPTSWQVAATGDFTGNGDVDILWSNANGDTDIWTSNGAGGFTATDLGVVPTSWQIAGTGDFNGTATSDILWHNTNGDTNIWAPNGSGGFTVTDLGVASTSWQIAGVGDFKGDGDSDILWRNSNGDTNLWTSNGAGGFNATDFGVVPTSWQIAGTGDFTGNGSDDILWRNTNGDTNIWTPNGSGGFSVTDLGIVPTSWQIAGTGDFNGTGTSDILWHNANGDTNIWAPNGSGGFTASDLGIIPASWNIKAA